MTMITGELYAQTRVDEPIRWALVLHGGAGSVADVEDREAIAHKRVVMDQALRKGAELLQQGKSSLDAVEAVIQILEDDPAFNAGVGAVLNARGEHELDASIMEGSERRCGAVAGVRRVKHPISAARAVMTRTRHVLVQGEGAETIAEEAGLEMVENDHFTSPDMIDTREKLQADDKARVELIRGESYLGTVGCVALDLQGNLAAGTSTGGLEGKRVGRIGDSPIIGAGTYADNRTCGVSCTGVGEEFIRNAAAYSVSAFIEFRGMSPADAVDEVLRRRLRPGDGGIIALDRQGRIVADYTTPAMAFAAADSTGRWEVHWADEASQRSSNSRNP